VGTSVKKYNLQGEEIGTVEVHDLLSQAQVNTQLIKDYIVALRANARAWTACTKTRSEVKHSTKKPHPQKGGGRSRQGCLVAPQYKGGGRVFGPKPKPDFHIRINQKEKKAAIRALIAEKINDGRFVVVDSFSMEAPKTKVVKHLLASCGANRRALVLGEGCYFQFGGEEAISFSIPSEQHDNFKKSVRNIPLVEFSLAKDIDGYAVALANTIVATESALAELEKWLIS
jgi:large subunit ribosomal protein L4